MIASPRWLAAAGSERLELPSGLVVDVPKCAIQFIPWRGPPLADTYGGKAVLEWNGSPLFAELVTLRMLEADGWTGAWVDSYRRAYRTSMPGAGPTIALPVAHEALLHSIRKQRGCYGGCWDLFAWRGTERQFVELKRKGKDRMRKGQYQWIEAALRSGLTAADFLIVEWEV